PGRGPRPRGARSVFSSCRSRPEDGRPRLPRQWGRQACRGAAIRTEQSFRRRGPGLFGGDCGEYPSRCCCVERIEAEAVDEEAAARVPPPAAVPALEKRRPTLVERREDDPPAVR